MTSVVWIEERGRGRCSLGTTMKRYAPVDAVEEFRVRSPWKTKSDGKLHARFALPFTVVHRYLTYDEEELARVPLDIRGLRCYTVRDLPKDGIGGTEFHRIRDEIVVGLDGSVEWECEDVYGARRTYTITPSNGVRIPPFILHTYRVLEEGSGLLVFANTLFDPEDPRTHDTFSRDEFRALQAERSG